MDSLTLLKSLITFRTTSDRIAEIKKALAFIKKVLDKKGIWTQQLILKEACRPVMYACTQKTKHPDILLVAHVDVVEGEDDQFTPRIKGDRIFGRGACDCKNHVAIAMQTLLHFAGSGKSIGAFFTTDEEIGGMTTKLLLEKGFNGKLVIMLDAERAIVYRQKGILNLKVICRGIAGHGSMPWKGINANEKLMNAYTKIQKLFPSTTAKNRWKETVNLGIMYGGDVINKVADYAEMQLNIRLTEKGDYKKIIRNIKKIHEVDAVEIISHHGFCYSDPKQPAISEFKRLMEKSLKTRLKLDSMHGATDAHNFAPYKSTVIITGAGFGKNYHGRDESVSIKEFLKFEKALIAYIEEAA